jgi:heat shock protein HspQ
MISLTFAIAAAVRVRGAFLTSGVVVDVDIVFSLLDKG